MNSVSPTINYDLTLYLNTLPGIESHAATLTDFYTEGSLENLCPYVNMNHRPKYAALGENTKAIA